MKIWHVILIALVLTCGGAAAVSFGRSASVENTEEQMAQLNSQLSSIALSYNMSPVTPPQTDLRPADIYVPPQHIRNCWRTDTLTSESFEGVQAVALSMRRGEAEENVEALRGIGLGISGASRSLVGVEISLSGWTMLKAHRMSYSWEDPECWAWVKKNKVPVIGEVLKFKSIEINFVTQAGTKISFDSARAANPSLSVSASAGWKEKLGGYLSASGEGLVAGTSIWDFPVNRLSCPDTSKYRPSNAFTELQGCPSAPNDSDRWYRFRLLEEGREHATIAFQAIQDALPIDTITIMIGTEAILAKWPRSTDRVILNRDSGGIWLTVERYEFAEPISSQRAVRLAFRELSTTAGMRVFDLGAFPAIGVTQYPVEMARSQVDAMSSYQVGWYGGGYTWLNSTEVQPAQSRIRFVPERDEQALVRISRLELDSMPFLEGRPAVLFNLDVSPTEPPPLPRSVARAPISLEDLR